MIRLLSILIALLIVWGDGTALGEMGGGVIAPVDRLIQNLEQQIAKDPDDHFLIYKLARVHYLAFANQMALVPSKDNGPEPWHCTKYFLATLRNSEADDRALKELNITPMERVSHWKPYDKARKKHLAHLVKENWRPKPIDDKSALSHAQKALKGFDKAISLDTESALYHLGKASLGNQCREFIVRRKIPKSDLGKLTSLSEVVVRDGYYKAFSLGIKKDGVLKKMPIEGLGSLISYEAGTAYLRIAKGTPELQKGQGDRITRVTKKLERLRNLRVWAVTPILIGAQDTRKLSDLIDPDMTVEFDLDGDGVPECWPWVRPTTGILVWNPTGDGQIRSGRQFFGSVTFFLLNRDGYEALRLLDDNQDGELAGVELTGIAVWYDSNQDGRSTSAEVVPVHRAGISTISAVPDRSIDGVLSHTHGIHYEGGMQAPTFDWVVSCVVEDDAN